MTPSHDTEPPWPDDAVEVARIGEAWGIKGAFKVHPHARDPKALHSSRRWFLKAPDAPRPAGLPPLPRLLRISGTRDHSEGVVATAHDTDDRNAAEALRGARVFVSRASFPTPADGEYYWIDLIGLRVVNREGQDLGAVTDLLDTGAHAVLRVAPAEGDERLIPFVGAYVDDVDMAARVIRVDWGLDY